MKKLCLAFLIGIVPCLQGCAYFAARGRDFTDILSLGISAGAGMGARAGATRLLAVEVMAQKDETFVGWNGRNWKWIESSYGLGFASWRMPGIALEERPPRRPAADLFTTSRRRTLFPNRTEIEDRRHTVFIHSGVSGRRAVDVLDIEVGVSALIGGLEASLKPGELADFLLGWFGLDIAGDDGLQYGIIVKEPQLKKKPETPAPEQK